ncbi:hypothetical protein N665_3429s0003 [Sinapis alba]|nr:hypothetical protein N665_3429s0003 [Sinapis alba]
MCQSYISLHRKIFDECVRWLKNLSSNHHIVFITRLIFQAAIYFLWKEKNSRIHNNTFCSLDALTKEIHDTINMRLDPLSCEKQTTNQLYFTSCLGMWFSFF